MLQNRTYKALTAPRQSKTLPTECYRYERCRKGSWINHQKWGNGARIRALRLRSHQHHPPPPPRPPYPPHPNTATIPTSYHSMRSSTRMPHSKVGEQPGQWGVRPSEKNNLVSSGDSQRHFETAVCMITSMAVMTERMNRCTVCGTSRRETAVSLVLRRPLARLAPRTLRLR